LDLNGLFRRLSTYKPSTAEEIETYERVKRYIYRKMEIGVLSGLCVTGSVNWFYRRELDRKVMLGGMLMGTLGGAIWGIL